MDQSALLELIKTDRYDFLRKHENLGGNILILTVAGSHAYGTSMASSDIDLRGVTVETRRDVLGLSFFEQFEERETDTVVYGLKKFVGLCLECNPNMMELLGTDEEQCAILTEEGRLLRRNASLFLSKRAIHSFGNYATAQLHRLQNALARDAQDQAEAEEHILHRVQSQMDHLSRSFPALTGGKLKLYQDQSNKPDMESEIFMDVELAHFPLRDFKTVYHGLSAVVRDYAAINHRNNKRDLPHLFKHAMHLLRLLATGTDILAGRGIVTHRAHEQELFLSIRKGELSFEKIFEQVDVFEEKFRQAAEQTVLPEQPDTKAVEEMLIEIYQKRLKI